MMLIILNNFNNNIFSRCTKLKFENKRGLKTVFIAEMISIASFLSYFPPNLTNLLMPNKISDNQ